ncbi:MutH/Sau3AI family endonuclease [Bacillus sp. FJAT-27986]|uniref:MutH/Sau3AI family endonuclease n=1 Tax=Bacillus sp. FJAT-27986 TaxID=1743146 RepID=UPI00080AE151|nr:MutH/Sau3AI family endonuclease [Bacillus sp. FJAT-27986]OCA86153.1 hypothetical protein A8L44_06980 [Bacillus sp. FJAT-27986]
MELNRFANILEKSWAKYYGLSIEEIADKLGLNFDLLGGKASTVTVINQLIKMSDIEDCKQVNGRNIAYKTVRLKANGMPKESMSFEQINFLHVDSEEWNNSFLKRKFENTIFCFIVFQINANSLYFKGFKLWKMPRDILENDVFAFWVQLKKVLNEGVKIQGVKRGSTTVNINNLPKSKENKVMHVRPKASDSNDKILLPDGQMITKQSYWFNTSYVADILKNMSAIPADVIKKSADKGEIDLNIQWSDLLTKDIYTIDEIIAIGKRHNPCFDEKHIKKRHFNEHGYSIQNIFILKSNIPKVETYLENKILEHNYFDISTDQIYQTPLAKRKIENLLNSYKLLQVEESLFLTEKGMEKANVLKSDIINYKTAVENFVLKDELFTLSSLRNKGFYHEVDGFGFDDIFYHSILRRPGRLSSHKFAGVFFYSKTMKKLSASIILNELMKQRGSLSLLEIAEEFDDQFKCNISLEQLENAILNTKTNLYYSFELHRIFAEKKLFLDYLYKLSY